MDKNDDVGRQIGYAIITALLTGFALYYSGNAHLVKYVRFIGDVFLRCLKMVIVPLVFSSIYVSIVNLGTPEDLGSIGKKALVYYFITTALAVLIGLVCVNIIHPGVGVNLGIGELPEHLYEKLSTQKGLVQTVIGVLINAIPVNPFEAMASTNILQCIVFSIFLGIFSLYHKKKSEALTNFIFSLEHLSFAMTHFIMKFAPYGVFVLLTDTIATTGYQALIALSKYMLVVIIGLGIHAVVLILIGSYRLKESPVFILKGIATPLFTAFSTASSAATLPLTMAAVEDNLGVSNKTAQFMLPLGATVNMDGTALYESIAVIFIAEAYGIELSIAQQVIVFVTASLAAVGAAAIPGAGLITMSIVLGAVGLPLEGIGLILSVDRILDMFRTSVNVLGDCIGTIVVDRLLRN